MISAGVPLIHCFIKPLQRRILADYRVGLIMRAVASTQRVVDSMGSSAAFDGGRGIRQNIRDLVTLGCLLDDLLAVMLPSFTITCLV